MNTMSILLATEGSPEAFVAAEWLNRWKVPDQSDGSTVTVVTPPSTAWAGAGGGGRGGLCTVTGLRLKTGEGVTTYDGTE